MRGLAVVTCPGGRLDLQGLYARASARCPQGFCTHIWCGQQEVDPYGAEIEVGDGTVFTAAFLPVQDPATGEVQGPADGGPGPSSHGPAPDQGPDGGPSGDFGPALDAPPSPDAGTGSSCSSSPADPPTHYQVAVGGGACTEEAQLGTLTRRPGGSAALGSMWGSAHASQQVLPEDKQARTSVAQAPSCRAGTVCSLCRLHGSVAVLPPRLVGFTIHFFCVAFCLPAAGFALRLVAWVAPLAARWLQRPLVVYCVLVQFATSTEGMHSLWPELLPPPGGSPCPRGSLYTRFVPTAHQ